MLNVLDRNGRETEGRSRSDEGFALPAVLFVTMMLSGLGIILLFTSGNERMAGRAVRESAKAFYAAEAGMNAVIADWNQFAYDTLMPGAGDSLVQAWQTLDNGCSYSSVIHRVDAGGDVGKRMYSARVRGRGPGALGGQRTLAVLVRTEELMLDKVIVTNGDLLLEGHIIIGGLCPGIHVNGDLSAGGGQHLTIIGDVTMTGMNFIDPASITDSLGNIIVPITGVDSMPIPQMDPYDYCLGEATYWLRNGHVVTMGPPADSVPLNLGGPPVQGWIIDQDFPLPTIYKTGSGELTDGTWCAEGNMEVLGDQGDEANPLNVTLIATEAMQLHGKPFFVAHHSKNVGLLAGGDLWVHGDLTLVTGVDGVVYSGSQCLFEGKTEIYAQIICYGAPDPGNAKDWADFPHTIHGHAGLNFGCGKLPYGYVARPLRQGGSWSQVIN